MHLKTTFIFLLLAIACSCNRKDGDINRSLKLAGDNRKELEKVIDRYGARPEDSVQLRMAKFLIANMANHFSYDTSELSLYRPILHKWKNFTDVKELLDKEWVDLKEKYPLEQHVTKNRKFDLQYISADYLIDHIDKSYEIWTNHPKKDSISFDDFFEYVMPYRKAPRIAVDDWLTFFSRKHGDFFRKHDQQTILSGIDTLLYEYSHYLHSAFILTDYPFLSYRDLLISDHSDCFERAWFNTMLLSSAGIPSTIDCIPAWANRNGFHTWNTVRFNNTFYAFDPFWEADNRRKYRHLYNNQGEDAFWGPFRIPKVYRYTYREYNDGPTADRKVEPRDIPPFFRYRNRKDVSHEYFETQDVTIDIEPVLDMPYCYLCVFNKGKWTPVQWGVRKAGRAFFKGMGCNIMYLPGFYKDGEIIPAGTPFILQPGGEKTFIVPTQETENITAKRLTYKNDNNDWHGKKWNGSIIQVADRPDFSDAVELHRFKQGVVVSETIHIKNPRKARYVRIIFPEKFTRIADVIFSDNAGKKLSGEILHGQGLLKNDGIEYMFDDNRSTIFLAQWRSSSKPEQVWVGLKFTEPEKITEIKIAPYHPHAYVYEGLNHELFYWDKNEWHSLGKKRAPTDSITYTNVPKNSLLWLRCNDVQGFERIFTYREGEQVFW